MPLYLHLHYPIISDLLAFAVRSMPTIDLLPSTPILTLAFYRRLARRGGVKRISGNIYDDIRTVLRSRLELVRPPYTVVAGLVM